MCLGPLTEAHVRFGVVEAEGLDDYDDVPREWRGDWEIFKRVDRASPGIGEYEGLHGVLLGECDELEDCSEGELEEI